MSIHSDSHNPQSQKVTDYNSIIHILITIPLDPHNYQEELTTIKHITMKKRYKSSIIAKLHMKHRNKSKTHQKEKAKLILVLTEYGSILSKIITPNFQKLNTTIAF